MHKLHAGAGGIGVDIQQSTGHKQLAAQVAVGADTRAAIADLNLGTCFHCSGSGFSSQPAIVIPAWLGLIHGKAGASLVSAVIAENNIGRTAGVRPAGGNHQAQPACAIGRGRLGQRSSRPWASARCFYTVLVSPHIG